MSSKPAGYSPAIGAGQNEKAAGIRAAFPGFDRSKWRGSEPLGAARPPLIPARPAIPIVAAIPVRAAIAAIAIHHAALEAAVPPAFRRTGLPYGSGWRGGASGRRRGSCRAGRPHPRSSSSPPPWSPWCRRVRAGAPPDRPASAHPVESSGLRVHPRIGAIDPQFWRNPAPRPRPAATAFPDRALSFSPALTAAIRASVKAARSSGLIRICPMWS